MIEIVAVANGNAIVPTCVVYGGYPTRLDWFETNFQVGRNLFDNEFIVMTALGFYSKFVAFFDAAKTESVVVGQICHLGSVAVYFPDRGLLFLATPFNGKKGWLGHRIYARYGNGRWRVECGKHDRMIQGIHIVSIKVVMPVKSCRMA